MSRAKIDFSLREKQGNRLTKLLKEKYGNRGDSPKLLPFKNDLINYEWIEVATLTRICHGTDPIDSHVKAFSAVLGVSEDFLLCNTDHRTEEDHKKAIIREYEEKKSRMMSDVFARWNTEASDRIRIVKSVISMLEDRNYKITYETIEGYQIVKTDKKYAAYGTDNSYQLSEDKFYSWLNSSEMNIPVSKEEWLHLSKVCISAPDLNAIELTMNDFMKMVHDINNEISHRLDSWFHLYSYEVSESWNETYAYMEESDQK